ncbi:glycosyltransferase [Arthrobacter rhizosphaerae]|uniref:glycosyltransferase n=1 Tax=Arthrobacter rhizosphaerae TaxID=2855490 RepID=UPI001FF420F5|nr:glycosyltransferase [Arthrobacter rhizosphaerae]
MAIIQINQQRARLYESLRTAHLERAHQLAPAAIIFRRRRYDFDADLTHGLELVEAGPLKAAIVLARSRVRALEVNEPLLLSSLPATAVVLLMLGLRRLFGGQRVMVVSYAIANSDPFKERLHLTWKSSVRNIIERKLAVLVWKRLDRVAFGTQTALETYYELLPASEHLEKVLIPALPSACSCQHQENRETNRVIYLGDFSARKGFPLVLAAWPAVLHTNPSARLTIIGKGALVQDALSSAAADSSIEVVVDPPRQEIHRQLRRAQVLVLPSQSTPIWREQVGLPIVEGLAHGCSIVTTTETGLASWLARQHHSVLPSECSSDALAKAIEHQLEVAAPARDITATLPEQDGRLAADVWLFEADTRARAK